MPEDKNFAKGLAIKSHVFADGGEILKVGVKVDEFCQWLMTLPAVNGWVNIQISKNRSTTAKGLTHHASEDTWKPKPRQEQDKPAERAQMEPAASIRRETTEEMPF
jgi:hypothetical protein